MSDALEELFVDEYRELKSRCEILKEDNEVLKKSVKNLEDEISRMDEMSVKDLEHPCKLARIRVFKPNTYIMSVEKMRAIANLDDNELYKWGSANVDKFGTSLIYETVRDFAHTVVVDGKVCAIDLDGYDKFVIVRSCEDIGEWFFASMLDSAREKAVEKMREMLMVAINEATDDE